VTSLYVIRGRDQGIRFELGEQPSISIGRDSSNEIRLHDTEISRQHAQIVFDGTDFELVDSGSSNGCFVNQERVSRQKLATGDRLRLGRTWLLFTQTVKGRDESSGPRVSIVDDPDVPDASRIVSTARPTLAAAREGAAARGRLEQIQSNLDVMVQTAQEVSHTLDIDQLCRKVLDRVVHALEADRGCIMLFNHDTDQLELRASVERETKGGESPINLSQTILDYVIKNEEGVLTSNAGEDDRWESGASIVKFGVREAICVPMQGRYGNVGILYVDTLVSTRQLLNGEGDRRFHAEHLDLMVAIGHQAALAVEDTSYYSAMLQSERLAAIGHTVATLSHHIKNMLQGMKGGGFLIEEGIKQSDNEAVVRGWKMVERNQQKIADLVLDMLTFSKEREPDLQWGDLNQTVSDVVELMSHRAQEYDVQMEWRPSPDLPAVAFDSEGLHRAILNLVTNAIDACMGQSGGCVLVATNWEPQSQRVEVQVRDNGEGIDPDSLDQIFKPFESTKGNRGTGLGLPATRKIVREHGGDVYVDSQPGQGSLFRLCLPMREELNPRVEPESPKTILIDPMEE
jgi:two-component system NtrC family sensor kinase